MFMKNINMAVDIGNTHTVMGFYSNAEFLYSWRINTDKSRTEDEYFTIIKQLADNHELVLSQVEKAAVSSVVPEMTRIISHLIKKYIKCDVKIVTAYTELGLKFPVDDPGFIGADLIVNAFSALQKYKTNCLICDFGTATTIQLIGKDGLFYGTVISPGVITSAKNLFESTALLSQVSLKKPQNLLGTNTTDALLSGIVIGNSLMLDGFLKAIKREFKHLEEIKTIATGGISELICNDSDEVDIIDKTLTLDGLNYICNK